MTDGPNQYVERKLADVALGVHESLPSKDYAEGPGLSATSVKRLLKSPRHYLDRLQHPERYEDKGKPTDFGKAFHMYFLEHDLFLSTYMVLPDDLPPRNTTIGMDAYLEFLHVHSELRPADADIDIAKMPGKREYAKWLEPRTGKQFIEPEYVQQFEWMMESIETHKTFKGAFNGGLSEASIYWRDPESGVPLKFARTA